MITIKTFIFNDFQVNTYLLYDESKECVIVDAGNYYEKENRDLSEFVLRNNLKPVRLLNTHCHIDHITGNLFVSEKFGLKPEAHQEEELLIKNAVVYGGVFGFILNQPPLIKQYLKDQDIINFGNSNLKVISVPGHSKGSIAFYSEDFSFIITGDALFKGSIGRTDLPGGDYDTLISSITQRLLILPAEVTVFPGHGTESTIGYETLHNPFLQ
jgi:glyoxylase-like metal-dependent hydrolase (beta-lactamase superfamily II)